MLIYGGAGVRKSWLVQHLSFAISCGIPWLGMRTEQARTMLVNCEISPAAFAIYRLRPMAARFNIPAMGHYVWSPDEDNVNLMLEDDRSYNQFMDFIRPAAPNVVILDCLQGCYGGDENDMERAGMWIRNVRRMQTELHCSVIVVHHSNKNQFASDMGKMRGTTRFSAWVDSVVYMVAQPTGIQLQFQKYRLSAQPEIRPVNAAFTDYLWTAV